MDTNEQKDVAVKVEDVAVKAEDVVVKKDSKLWAKYGKYVYIAAGVLAFIIGLVWAGQWYASGKANELAISLGERFKRDNQGLYDNVAINQYLIDELKKKVAIQAKEVAIIKKRTEGEVIDIIKEKNPAKLANKYDNLIDSYTVPSSFGR